MSRTVGLSIVSLVTATTLALAPQAASAQSTPSVSRTDGLFRPSDAPGLEETYLTPEFASSHAANLLRLKSGDLLCVWFSGSREGDSDVGIMLARLPKGSKQWSEPQRIDHRPGESYQNPVVFQAPNGSLWIIHTTQPAGQGQANAKVLVTKSADGGKTWTTPAVLFEQPGAFVRQPLITMSNGDWLLPMYFTPSKGITNGAETNYSVVKISGDQGAHWKDCAIPDSNGYVQPNVVRLQDNRYVAFFRSRYADYIYKSASSDGCAWTAPQKTQLPNNNSSIQVTKLANGHLVIAFNNVRAVVTKGKPQTGPRKPLSVALSEDGGETWGWVRDLETGIPRAGEPVSDPNKTDKPREEFSYPSIVQAADGKINVAYTYRRLTIKIVRFDESWLKTGTTTGTFTGDAK
jgi:predicted neuraminidase